MLGHIQGHDTLPSNYLREIRTRHCGLRRLCLCLAVDRLGRTKFALITKLPAAAAEFQLTSAVD